MNAEKASSNQHLMYSEYVDTSAAKHVVQLIESKRKEKPVMKFTRSSVLTKVLDLIPRLKESEAELNTKDENERNIEVCAENTPVIEMNVAIPKGFKDNESEECTDESNDEEIFNKDESNEENSSSSDDSEESDEENLSSSNCDIVEEHKDIEKSFLLQFEDQITHDSSSALTTTKLCSKSEMLNLVSTDLNISKDSTLEPPTKKLCEFLD